MQRVYLIFATALTALAIYFTGITIIDTWAYFIANCPSKDVLTWDPNLRMVYILDQMDDIAQGRILAGIFPFLESPTWPPLRSMISMLLFYLSPIGPDTVLDLSISYFFYAAIFPSLYYIALRLPNVSLANGLIAASLTSLMLLHTREIPAFALSSMLETQSLFFILWVAWFLFRLWNEDASLTTGKASRSLKLGLLFSIGGMFFTKYPYGIILLIAIACYELLLHWPQWFQVVLYTLRQRYSGWRGLAFALLVSLLVVVPLIGRVPGVEVSFRLIKNLYFLIPLIVFIDINLFFWREGRADKPSLVPLSGRLIWLYGVVPVFGWMFLNPDRVGSAMGMRVLVNEYTSSFTYALFFSVFDANLPFLIIFGLAFVALVLIAVRIWLDRYGIGGSVAELESSNDSRRLAVAILDTLWHLAKNPMVAVLALLLLKLFVLEVGTSNKQPRYILHLVPALLLWSLLLTLSLPRLIESIRPGPVVPTGRLLSGIAIFLALTLLVVPGRGLVTGDYLEGRPLCFTGDSAYIFEPAREVVAHVEEPVDYILINNYHRQEIPTDMVFFASEVDLLLRLKFWGESRVRSDSRQLESWSDFDRLVVTLPDCGAGSRSNESVEDIDGQIYQLLSEERRQRATAVGVKLELLKQHDVLRGDGVGYCLEIYRIEPQS